MKRFMAFLISCSLLLSMTPSAFATDDIEGGNLDEIGTTNAQDIAGDSTDGQSLTKEEAKLIPGGEYTFTDKNGTHTWKINSTFDFVENNIAYKQVSDTEVEVAAWYWVWDCGSEHTHSPGTLADREYKNRADGITVPTSITHEEKNYTVIGIGTRAFEGVTGTPVTVPEGITYLGHSAFWGFGGDSVDSLTIPTTVTSIDDSCFADIKVSTVTFTAGSNLKSIGDTAFRNCQNLTEVVLPEGLETMGSSVFALSNSLNITIPGTVENFNKETLSGYSGNLDNITFTDGPANLIKENGIIYGYNKILEVRDKTVTEVVIPDGITEIGEKAFSGCNNLQSITIPDSVTSIGNEAFHGRSTLTTINGGNGVTALGDWAFMDCTALTTVNFPNVKTIGEWAFDSCTALVSVNLPSIETIGDKAFYKCTALSDLSFLQNSVQEIGYEAFYGCQAIESIVLPESLRTIGDEAFANCLNVKEISLAEGVKTIGERAFDLTEPKTIVPPFPPQTEYVNDNPQLNTINIPSTVTSLGANFLRGIQADGKTTLISQIADPSVFEGAVEGISGDNKPTLIYPEEYKEAYEGENSPVGDLIPSEGSGSELKYSLSIPATASVYTGNTTTLAVTSTIPTGATLEVTSSNGAATASLSGDNRTITVTGVSDGTATITVAMKLNGTTLTSKSCTVTVTTYNPPSGGGGGSSDPTYSISLPGKVTGGEVSIQKRYAEKGETVTITVTPDDGYELDELIVTDSKGNKLDLTDKGNGKFTFKMPAGRVEIEVSFQEIVIEPGNPFVDVSTSDYYYDAVLWAVENGVTNGTSATTFGPNMAVSRAQMVTFLWRAHGSPKATGTNPFTDVSTSDYYYDAVLWAVANGVTNGTSATTFSPDTAVTRSQAVTFQWRAAGSPVVSGSSFGDVATDAYYVNAVTWAVANGITNGTGGNTFSPDVVVSRAQAVTFLYREQE